jgi:hypothetical protein
MLPCRDAQGIQFEVAAADRARLEAIVADRNCSQKHVERARIVLLSAEGLGTLSNIHGSGGCRTAAGQEPAAGQDAVAQGGRAGGRSDARWAVARPSPNGPAGRWPKRRHLAALGPADLGGARLAAAPVKRVELSKDPAFAAKLQDIVGLYVDPPAPCGRAIGRRKERSIGPSRACR